MLHSLLLLTVAHVLQGFVLDATARHEVVLPLPVDSVRALVRQVATLESLMPGVIEISERSGGGYLYRTEREIPFSGTMRTDFQIIKVEGEDGSVTYRTPGVEAENWMSYRLEPVARGGSSTLLSLRMRVRLVRTDGTQIHLFAPLLGETYLSKRMEEDLAAVLKTFADRLAQRYTLVHGTGN